MKKATMDAIQRRIENGETRFYIGKYFYECNGSGMIRRREQEAEYLPTSDWELVANWNPAANAFEFV